jgi:SAM-dependent methyltransferase
MSLLPPTAARFSNRVADYVRYRPSYPAEAIDAILAGLGDPPALVAADVGAGTGISARLLAARGVRTIAVEPNPDMSAAIGPGIELREAPATATGLPDASVDLVTAFQAFHWFAEPATIAEFRRILRPGGRVALCWNLRDDDDPFTRAYGDIAEAVERDTDARMAGERTFSTVGMLQGGGLRAARELHFRNEQRLGLEALLGRARSSSYVPREGPGWEAIANGLREVHARFADERGEIGMTYDTVVYLAEEPR